MQQLNTDGYQIVPQLLPANTVDHLALLIKSNSYNDGFGIREFLPNNPEIVDVLLRTPTFGALLNSYLTDPICVRSIYFDKPPKANWVVGWHQDLTMNLRSIPNADGWLNIRTLKDRVVAQPPLSLLEEMVTLRLHLDDTTEANGALRVIAGSHLLEVVRTDAPQFEALTQTASSCVVPSGGVMLMKPLTLHASRRSTGNGSSRRVIHLEFTNAKSVRHLDLQEAIAFRARLTPPI